MWDAVWPKKPRFPPYAPDFFDHSEAMACKNPRRLAKNGHFLFQMAPPNLLPYDYRTIPNFSQCEKFGIFCNGLGGTRH